jgi:hypothetical protein
VRVWHMRAGISITITRSVRGRLETRHRNASHQLAGSWISFLRIVIRNDHDIGTSKIWC